MSGDHGGAAFVARHGGGIRLLITRRIAHYMLEKIEEIPPAFLIIFDAERGGRSTLIVEPDLLSKMQHELTTFRAGPGCLDSAPLDLSGFLPGYAERGA
ncbi:hypothetical protein, partial [Bradyrhizobium liaoningense]